MIVGNLSGLDHTVYAYNQLEVLGGKALGLAPVGFPKWEICP